MVTGGQVQVCGVQDLPQHRTVDLGRLQALQQPVHSGSAALLAPPLNQASQNCSVVATWVIELAPKHSLRRQTEVQQDRLRFSPQPGRK